MTNPRWVSKAIVAGIALAFLGVGLVRVESLEVWAVLITVVGGLVSSGLALWDDAHGPPPSDHGTNSASISRSTGL